LRQPFSDRLAVLLAHLDTNRPATEPTGCEQTRATAGERVEHRRGVELLDEVLQEALRLLGWMPSGRVRWLRVPQDALVAPADDLAVACRCDQLVRRAPMLQVAHPRVA